MIPRYIEYLRFDTLKDLYIKLTEITLLKDKIMYDSEKIKIILHQDFILTIKLNSGFNIFINGKLESKNIEDADIWEIINSYLDENKIFVEFVGLFGKIKIKIFTAEQFEHKKEKLLAKQKLKVYTINKLIFKN